MTDDRRPAPPAETPRLPPEVEEALRKGIETYLRNTGVRVSVSDLLTDIRPELSPAIAAALRPQGEVVAAAREVIEASRKARHRHTLRLDLAIGALDLAVLRADGAPPAAGENGGAT